MRKSQVKRKSNKHLKIGTVVSFYNVKEKKSVRKAIKGFMKRSTIKGRDITIAYASDNGTKICRIVGNRKSGSRK